MRENKYYSFYRYRSCHFSSLLVAQFSNPIGMLSFGTLTIDQMRDQLAQLIN
jgi:hypothetical protein